MAAAPHTAHQTEHDAPAPKKPYVVSPALAYDPAETLEQFFARKHTALEAGERAWRNGTIKAHHQKLYERLVDAVGAHAYCWIKVETLASEFGIDDSTIKRWLATLDRANLIRRQRQYGVSSRTYITAYDRRVSNNQAEQASIDDTRDEAEDQQVEPVHTDEHTDQAAAPAGDGDAGTEAHDASFFERTAAPSNSAFLHRHIKEVPFNTCIKPSGTGSGGKEYTLDITSVDPDIRAILEDEAVNSDRGKAIVAACPLEELRAIQGYLDHQTNVRDRSGLFVWLAERDFGAHLLAGRRAAPRRRTTKKEPQRYDAPCPECGERSAYMTLDPPFCPACRYGGGPTDHELAPAAEATEDEVPWVALWQHIVTAIDTDELSRSTWLKPVRIVACEDGQLILRTPNIFVRQEIEDTFLDAIRQHASAVLGESMEIVVVIGRDGENGP